MGFGKSWLALALVDAPAPRFPRLHNGIDVLGPPLIYTGRQSPVDIAFDSFGVLFPNGLDELIDRSKLCTRVFLDPPEPGARLIHRAGLPPLHPTKGYRRKPKRFRGGSR